MGAGTTTYNLTYEYEFPAAWRLANILLRKAVGVIRIEGIHIYSLPESLETRNAFSLANKSPLHYAFFGLAIFIPIFCIVALIACVRTRVPKRKWLWIILILLGFFSLKFNWTTGQIGVIPLSFTLLGAAYTQQFFGPVIIQIAAPIGAILFWLRRPRWIEQNEAQTQADLRS